jgi:hypothetical protein
MIRNLKIGPRLLILIGVPLLCLLAVGVSVLVVLENATQTEIKLKELVADQVRINKLSEVVQVDLRKVVVDPYLGSITWASANERLSAAKTRLETIWDEYLAGFSNDEINALRKAYSEPLDGIREVYKEVGVAIKDHDRNRLFSLLANDYESLTAPYFNALAKRGAQLQTESQIAFQRALEQTRWFYYGTIIIVILGTLVAGSLGHLIYQSISQPISRISDTVHAVGVGRTIPSCASGGIGEIHIARCQSFLIRVEAFLVFVIRLATMQRVNRQQHQSIDVYSFSRPLLLRIKLGPPPT